VGRKILTIAVCTLLLAGFTVSPAPCGENIAADNAAIDNAAVDNVAVGNLEILIELLRAKGIISAGEAAGFVRRVKEAVPPAGGNGAPQTSGAGGAAGPETKFPPVEKVPMSGEDLKGMIESLRVQGIVGGEEAEGLVRRVGPTGDPGAEAARKQPVISGEKEIPYLRTAQAAVYIKTMIGILRVQEILDAEEAGILLRRYEKKAPADRIAEGIVRELRPEIRQDVRESLKADVKAEVAQEAKTRPVPEWTKRIRIGGDLRLRYDGDFFGSGNADLFRPDQPTQVLNTHENRHRLRIRARLNMNARVTDEVDAGLRLATGTPLDPVSTNQTLGDYQNKKNFLLDLAYARWKPAGELTLWGGRMPNPWFSTDLVWDPDVNFDGVAGTYARRIGPALGGFLTLGAFSLQEVEFSPRDKWLFGGQAGAEYAPRKELSARLGVAFYAYLNIAGKPNDPGIPGQQDFTSPLFQQKGNTLFDIDPSSAIKTALASEFKELNVTGAFDVGFRDPVHFVFLADYVKNLGFDKDDIARRTGVADIKNETTGYQVGVAVGYPAMEKSGDWKGYLFFKHLESDAVVDSFADSDFHLGGTNAEGFVLGGEYGLARNVWLSTKWLSANEISGPPLSIDVLLVDLNMKF